MQLTDWPNHTQTPNDVGRQVERRATESIVRFLDQFASSRVTPEFSLRGSKPSRFLRVAFVQFDQNVRIVELFFGALRISWIKEPVTHIAPIPD
jgi:hypothetical protein